MVSLLWKVRGFHQLNVFELQAIYRLRQEVFVVEQHCAYLDADGRDQFSDHVFGVHDDGRVLAYCRIVQPGIACAEVSIGRVATHPDVRNEGLGRIVMDKAFKSIDERYGQVPVRIEAQLYLKEFYTSLGFETVGETYLLDGIEHIEMLRPVENLLSKV